MQGWCVAWNGVRGKQSGKNIRLLEAKIECWPWSEDERTDTIEVDDST